MNATKPELLPASHYNMKAKFIFFILTIAFFSCSTPRNFQPINGDKTKAEEKAKGIPVSDLQQGYSLYTVKCSGCHRLHEPSEFTPDKWQTILTKMFVKAKMNDESEKTLIHNYVIANSR